MNRDASETCPICLGYAERGRDRDYGDKKQIRCERCGAYQISGTALAMLSRRFDDDPLARARFSHAVRMHSDHEEWFMVVSTHVDNFANRPLPSITEQAHLLVKWIAQKLKDDYLGNIRIESPESLAGFVGVVDGTRVARLVEHCAEGKLIVFDRQKNSVGLTSTGWELAQSA